MDYTYRFFCMDKNPRREVAREEYEAMRRNLNYFMHKMLRQLYEDEEVLGKPKKFWTWQLLMFIGFTLATVAGMIFIEHPAGKGLAGFLTLVMGMSIFAVPIVFWTDRSREKDNRHNFIQEVKSYYMYQHSLMYKTEAYEEYVEQVPEAPLKNYEKYLRKYLR